MLRILVNSYTCCPGMGSEQGMGWNWITSLAKTGEVELYVITESQYYCQILEWMRDEKNKDIARHIHWLWNPVSPRVRTMCWNQGDWRFYFHYRKWQQRTEKMALALMERLKHNNEKGIDIIHQLNMIGFREPGYLWKLAKVRGIPFVWGPVDAKDKFPLRYSKDAPFRIKLFLLSKNLISVMQLKYSRRVKQAAMQACVLLAASTNSVRSFKNYLGIDSILMNETGCNLNKLKNLDELVRKEKSQFFHVLWIGKMDFRKQLGVAIRCIAKTKGKNMMLHVVGAGDPTTYKAMAEKLGVMNKIKWYGELSHDKVQQLMRSSDLLLFTSVAEGTPHVVLESIANGLPVLCHYTCGHGDIVTEDVGRRIQISSPIKSSKEFAAIIDYFYNNRSELEKCSKNCLKRAEKLSWENKAKAVVELYNKVLTF